MFQAPVLLIRGTLRSYIKQSMLMSWIVTIAGKEAHPVTLVSRVAWRHRQAFTTIHSHVPPTTTPTTSIRQRCRWLATPLSQRGQPDSPSMILCTRRACTVTTLSTEGQSGVSVALRRAGRHRRRLRHQHRALRGSDSCGIHIDGVFDGRKRGAGPEEISRLAARRTLGLNPLIQEVTTSLRDRCGVREGDVVLVLISGGCDSVALLLALHEAVTSSALNIHLEAVHFNHALRGEGSDDDEAFVVDLAAELKIPLHIRRWERRDEGGTGGAGAGMQARARDWRRAEAKSILGGITGVDRIGFIATAHHRDDQVETVLMKALRGAHITKMQGMTWCTAPFVRPLLGITKADLITFLREKEQTWREDGSNQVAKYARNRVRLQLIPLLQELAGGSSALDARLNEVSRQSLLARDMVEEAALRWEREHLIGHGKSADRLEGVDQFDQPDGPEGTGRCEERRRERQFRRDEFPLLPFLKQAGEAAAQRAQAPDEESVPELLREALMHRFVTANTGDRALSYAHLQLLMGQVDNGGREWSHSLGDGLCVRRVGDFLRIERDVGGKGLRKTTTKPNPVHASPPHGAGQSSFGPPSSLSDESPMPWTIRVSPPREKRVRKIMQAGEDSVGREDVAAGTEESGMILYNVPRGAQLRVRRRRDGDRFHPVWLDKPTKLKGFLRGQGVPLHRRDEVALICDGHDTVIAVYPSYPAHAYCRDGTGAEPVRVRIEGTPLCCPRPQRGSQRT